MDARERLHHLRKDILQMTQAEFCSRLEIRRSTLSNIEGKRIDLTERNINDICRAYNVSRNWFLYGAGSTFVPVRGAEDGKRVSEQAAKLEDDEIFNEIALLFTKLDMKYRIQAIGYLQRLREEQARESTVRYPKLSLNVTPQRLMYVKKK